MQASADTIPVTTPHRGNDMGKRKVGRPPVDEPTQSVSARVPVSILRQLKFLERTTRPKPSMSSIIVDAIEQYLARIKLPAEAAREPLESDFPDEN